jgi:polysaccharide biosynthesis transport protein
MTLLRRHGVWLIVATVVGIAGAWLYHALGPQVYLSTAQVDVEANPAVATNSSVPNMATEQQVATSGVVVDGAAAALEVPSQILAGSLSAKVTSTANVLSIGCTNPVPVHAQRCAAAAAAAYIGFRNQSTATKAQQARDPLHVTLVTPANLPESTAGPGKKILLPIGAILGLALGAGAIVLRDRFDDRVRDRADMERCLKAPVLAAIPQVRPRAVDPAFVFSHAPHSSTAEAYRYLRSRLKPLLNPAWGGGTVLMVTGPKGLEGSTCVAVNVARVLAQAGASVLLVDADLRQTRHSLLQRAHPSLSEIFGAENRPGLDELLTGKASLSEVVYPVQWAGLRFLPIGGATDHDADIIAAADLARVFVDVRALADVVIVDSSPVLVVSDAVTLTRVSDLVMMVADGRRTMRAAISAAAQEIQGTGRALVGILNREPARANRLARPEAELRGSSDGSVAQSAIVTTSGPNGQRPPQRGAAPRLPDGLVGGAEDPTWVYGAKAAWTNGDDPPA